MFVEKNGKKIIVYKKFFFEINCYKKIEFNFRGLVEIVETKKNQTQCWLKQFIDRNYKLYFYTIDVILNLFSIPIILSS